MSTLVKSRGICDVCGKSQKIKQNGRLCKHGACKGENTFPRGETSVTMTQVAVCLDRSTSMHGLRHQAINAFNQMMEPIRSQKDGYLASYYTFGDSATREWTDRKPSSLPLLDADSYQPSGMTAMLDAIGMAIEDLRDDGDSSYLVIVITDGEENYSKKWNSKRLADKIKELQRTDRWTFAISCPKGQSQRLSQNLKIPLGNFEEWDQTSQGAAMMAASNKGAVSRFTDARSRGSRSVQNFYVNIGKKDVKDVLKQVGEAQHGRYKKITTKKACQISEAITDAGITFVKGCAYYELQKPETVQHYKRVVLEHRDTGKLYDQNTRDAIGLGNGTGKVKLGNLGDWIVWVQSTSVNRKLLAKMKLLVDQQM